MPRKKENIAKHSAAELQTMKAAGDTHSDWNVAARKAVPDGSDPDDAIKPRSMRCCAPMSSR
jgi:hypothetical protein